MIRVAHLGVNTRVINAHGPLPQPTAFRSPTCSLTNTTGRNLAKFGLFFIPKSGHTDGHKNVSIWKGLPTYLPTYVYVRCCYWEVKNWSFVAFGSMALGLSNRNLTKFLSRRQCYNFFGRNPRFSRIKKLVLMPEPAQKCENIFIFMQMSKTVFCF